MSEETQQYDGREEQQTLLEMLRKDLIGELEAINQYERHARMTNVRPARDLFQEIADDEKHHVADLLRMIMKYDNLQRQEIEERVCRRNRYM